MKRASSRMRAYEHLVQTVSAFRDKPDTPLPGMRRLAAEAGVSLVTMQRALDMAKAESRIVTMPGAGTFARASGGTPPVSTDAQPASRLCWEQAADSLQEDILGRNYPPGERLPLMKELAARYGVSVSTIRKALAHMVDTGVLLRRDGGFRPAHGVPPRMHASVCVMIHGVRDYLFETLPERDHVLLRSLAEECRHRGIHLDFCSLEFDARNRLQPEKTYESYAHAHPGTLFLGFMVLASWMDRSGLLPVVRDCVSRGYCIAILNGNNEVTYEDIAGLPGVFNVSYAFSTTCGERVGHHLVALNHRSIAYIVNEEEHSWSTNRRNGLSRVVQRFGGTVRMVAMPPLDRAASRGLSALLAGHGLSWMSGPGERAAVERTFAKLTAPIGYLWTQEMQERTLQRMLSKLLRAGTCTAWVIESGYFATRCLKYLRRRGIRIPEELSFVSFDDLMDATLNGCTSYNFDMSAVARAGLDMLTLPRKPRGRMTRADREAMVEGFLNVRTTTGTARNVR